MVVLATGHHVRCILWEKVSAFNKVIGFLCGLKIFVLDTFCEYLQSSLCLMLQMFKKNTVKDMPINNHELLNHRSMASKSVMPTASSCID